MLGSKEELIEYRSQSGVQRLNGHTKRGSETLGAHIPMLLWTGTGSENDSTCG